MPLERGSGRRAAPIAMALGNVIGEDVNELILGSESTCTRMANLAGLR